MSEQNFEKTKQAVLSHIESLFAEIEEETVMSHQEKYALLEDALANASDHDELRVAFDQWYREHAEDVGFDYHGHEVWEHALGGDEEFEDDGEDVYDDEEEEESDDIEEAVFDDA